MGRIARSWELAKASWAVLLADKELLVFPVISVIAVGIVMATFAVPMILTGMIEKANSPRDTFGVFGFLLAFLFYFVQYTIVFYCNSALVGAALIRLKGGNPTLGDGFRIANKHIGAIMGYALLSASAGMILRAIAGRGILGRIAASVFGFAWNIATFLAVPVLIMEGVGPIEAVRRSTRLLKKTWGEQIAGNVGIGLVFGIISLFLTLGFVGALFVVVPTASPVAIVGTVVVFLAALMILGLIGSALTGIYAAAVYRYATEGDAGAAFDPELVRSAFRVK